MADYAQRMDYGVSSQQQQTPIKSQLGVVTNQNGSMADSGFETFDFLSSETPSPDMTPQMNVTSNGHEHSNHNIPFDPLQPVEENGDPPLLDDVDFFDPLAPLPVEEFLSPAHAENETSVENYENYENFENFGIEASGEIEVDQNDDVKEEFLIDVDDDLMMMNSDEIIADNFEEDEDCLKDVDEDYPDARRDPVFVFSKERDSGAECDSLDDEIQHQQHVTQITSSTPSNASASPSAMHDDDIVVDKNQKNMLNNATYTSTLSATVTTNGIASSNNNKKGKNKAVEQQQQYQQQMEKKMVVEKTTDKKIIEKTEKKTVIEKVGKVDNKVKRSKSERNFNKTTTTTTTTAPVAEKENVAVKNINSHDNSDDEIASATITTGVDVKQLTQSYRQQTPDHYTPEKSREKIETGISIRDLRTNYNQENGDRLANQFTRSMGDLSRVENRNPEFHLGVSVQALRASYCDLVKIEENKNRFRTKVDTGVSIDNLKSTFSTDTSMNNNINGNNVMTTVESPGIRIDRARITRSFSQDNYPLYALLDANDGVLTREENNNLCRICGRPVFLMDRIKAEKSVFHRTCFRCKECNKQLAVDSYCSHEGVLYCKLHFKQLFQPKAKFDESGPHLPRRKSDESIKENIPKELPADVVRSCDKPDYGLNEIPSLQNIKSRFESGDFESDVTADLEGEDNTQSLSPVKRSGSILNKMAKFQNGFQNGAENEESSEEEGDEQDGDAVNGDIARETRKKEKLLNVAQEDEQEVVFQGMGDLKTQWEKGAATTKEEEWARETQDELNKLRQKICQGKGSVKALYENAVQESDRSPIKSPSVSMDSREIKSIAEKWERGEVLNENEKEKFDQFNRERQDDLNVFKESGTSIEARNIFKKMDETIVKTGVVLNLNKSPSVERSQMPRSPREPATDAEIIRSTTEKEEIVVDSSNLQERFKFFENYQDPRTNQERKRFTITPPREVNDISADNENEDEIDRDPNIIRSSDNTTDDAGDVAGDIARKMLDKFRQLERGNDDVMSPGPKPLKRITPPRDYVNNYDDNNDDDDNVEPDRDPSIIRASDKIDEVMSMETRSLRAKFENWTGGEDGLENSRKDDDDDDGQPSIDTTKNLKAKFEALQVETGKGNYGKGVPKVNRFVDPNLQQSGEQCSICNGRVYAMEKLEVNNQRVHKSCFKCSHCSCPLRLDNYTVSQGIFYCAPHFRQLFIIRGNYDEGFGREQHKEKWNRSRSSTPTGNADYANDVTEEMYA